MFLCIPTIFILYTNILLAVLHISHLDKSEEVSGSSYTQKEKQFQHNPLERYSFK
jgi:hypothetical protein